MTNKSFIGIDLGTTFSAIAHINEHGVPEIIENSEGERTTPSVVLFDGEEVSVGTYAKDNMVVYPGQGVEFVKRHMGDDLYCFEYNGKKYNASKISSFILKKLKDDAEERLGTKISDVVITVPAYFGDPQRRATIEAGEMAGLNVVQVINEPTAAAYSYGLHKLGENQRVLVFDLGGGTFDVTVIEIGNDRIEVKATNGDHQLGGQDWDEALIQYIAERFESMHGISPFADEGDYQALKEKALSAKISLSNLPKVNIIYGCRGKTIKEEITRERFEEITTRQVEQCQMWTERVLEEADYDSTKIDVVLLAGGSTRMPMVVNMLKDYFGKEPSKSLNPDECVALGAAVKAALLKKETWALPGEKKVWGLPSKMEDINVTSHSFGLAIFRDNELYNDIIISKNTPYPIEKSKSDYVTTYDNQETLDIYVLEGEAEDPRDCDLVGSYQLYDIPKRPAGKTGFKVTYRYNENQIVEVEAVDVITNKSLPLNVSRLKGELEVLRKGPYTKYVGQHKIPGIKTDKFGNAFGSEYDLAVDGAFQDYLIAVLHLYTGEGFDFRLPEAALKEKGFKLHRWTSAPSVSEFKSVLGKASQLWLVSDKTNHLKSDHMMEIYNFFESGRGIYVWGDNDPYYADANILMRRLFDTEMLGNVPGNQTVNLKEKSCISGFVSHLIFTGIEFLYEGITIASIYKNEMLRPLIYGSNGNLVAAIYDMDGKRAIVDGGFTRLYCNWDSAGTGRYVKNAASWLVNYEKFGY